MPRRRRVYPPRPLREKDPEDPRSDADMEVEWAMQQMWLAERPRSFVGDGGWRLQPPTPKQLDYVIKHRIDVSGCSTSGEYSDRIDAFIREENLSRARGDYPSPLGRLRGFALDYAAHILAVQWKHHGF